MSTELSASLTSLAGVLLGGTISYVVQRFTQRSADRAEARRQSIARAEARYAERVAIIDRFLVDAQDAERVAFDHHRRGPGDAEWQRTADAAMDRLYVAEKMVRVLCTDQLHEAAHAFTNTIRDAIFHQPDGFDVGGHLAPERTRFLQTARWELDQLQAPC